MDRSVPVAVVQVFRFAAENISQIDLLNAAQLKCCTTR